MMQEMFSPSFKAEIRRLIFFSLEKFHDVLLTRLSTHSGKGFHDPLSINPFTHLVKQIYFFKKECATEWLHYMSLEIFGLLQKIGL